MLREHTLVAAKFGIWDNIPEGSIGTIVHVYKNVNAYEVEFIINGLSQVEFVTEDQIQKLEWETEDMKDLTVAIIVALIGLAGVCFILPIGFSICYGVCAYYMLKLLYIKDTTKDN